jgi:hypothetical protein
LKKELKMKIDKLEKSEEIKVQTFIEEKYQPCIQLYDQVSAS